MSTRRGATSVSTGFGSRLAEVLAEQGINQQAFAERLKSSPSFISALVRGLKAPGSEFLVSIHGALGVSIDWLLTGNGPKYGQMLDAEQFQSILVQVQLARLATSGANPIAVALLSGAHLNIDFGVPVPSVDLAATEGLLSELTGRNQDVAIALSIMDRLSHTEPSQRGAAVASAIADIVAVNKRPEIFRTLQAAKPTSEVSAEPSSDDDFWNGEHRLPGYQEHDQPGTKAGGDPPGIGEGKQRSKQTSTRKG